MTLRIKPRKIEKTDKDDLRIANAPFLNSAPYQLVKELDGVTYREVLPAECGRMLFEEDADLSLIPIAEWFNCGDEGRYELLPYGIAAERAVTSVLLFSESALEEIEEIFVDVASRSSVALLRILMNIRGIRWQNMRFHRIPAAVALQRVTGTSAALVIGDSARLARGKFPHELDLAEEWHKATGLPMVFAIWAARKDALNASQKRELLAAFERGLASRAALARDWADSPARKPTESARQEAERYVTEHIQYEITHAYQRGAEQFRLMGIDCGIFPKSAPRFDISAASALRSSSSLDGALARAANGERISIADALLLARSAALSDLALAADERRRDCIVEDKVSYIVDRNINYTNICNVYCRFCAFYRAPGREGGYVLTKEQIGKKIEEMLEAGGIQILLQGGLHPELGIEYYEDLFRWIKERYPINLHALSADEIIHITRVSAISIEETLQRLITAGLGSFPGGGAEILVDRVRGRVARLKSSTEEWLEVHRTAHRLGLRSTCTMMFGVQESWEDRILHLHKLRSLQDDTKGFTAFITWPFQDDNLKLARGDTSASEYLRVQAISRLFLDNIDHIQSSWVTMGPSIGQVALEFGADDFGSLMFEENVVSSAGTTYCLDNSLIERHILEAGFLPWRRDVHYQAV